MIQKYKTIVVLAIILVSCLILVDDTLARERYKKRGEIFQVAMSLNDTYDVILNFLKEKGYTFEPATRKDIGQIITTFSNVRLGRTRDSAIKVECILINEGTQNTTVEIAVTFWNQFKGSNWTEQGVEGKQTTELVQEIKPLLGLKTDVPKETQ